MPRSNPEARLHIAILHYLQRVLPRRAAATLIHVPNGENRTWKTGVFLKRLGVKPGVEDLQFIHEGPLYCLEVKPEGRYQSPDQKDRERAVVAAGGFYAVVRSIDDVRELLAHWGIETKESR